MVTEAQKRAVKKYRREKTHPFSMLFSPVDDDLWAYLCEQKSKAAFVKSLIRKDMEQHRKSDKED